ncbi:MAG: aldo/keto reductase [Clostridia bacterium]|nr:aldo/keto reductase [Clostridia bacterium]
MQKKLLGNTGLEVSQLGFGGLCLNELSREEAQNAVDYALQSGINYFEVAPSYGTSQEALGEALYGRRKDVILACKTLERSGEKARAELENSLKVLKTERFDVYQLHGILNTEELDAATAPGGALEAIVKAKNEGLIKHIGITGHSENAVLEALNRYPFETVMFPLYFARNIAEGWGSRIAARCRDENIGFIAMKAMAHRHYREDWEWFTNTWYRPIVNNRLAVASMRNALAQGADMLISPGHVESLFRMIRLLPQALEQPFCESDRDLLAAEAERVKDKWIMTEYD